MNTTIRILLLMLLSALPVFAHGPFDSSSTLSVLEDRMELELVVGPDAGREILKHAGMSGQRAEEILLVRGTGAMSDLDTSMASNLFLLTAESAVIPPIGFTVNTDGLEVLFALEYPRPVTGEVKIEATYFKAVDGLRQGVLVAKDEERNQLAAALLSRSANSTTVFLPARRTTAATESGIQGTGRQGNRSGTNGIADVGANGLSGQKDSTNDSVMGQPVSASSPLRPMRPSFREFLVLGIEHILTGYDHLLFLGALLVGVRKVRSMLGIITCFTLAHSVTLALAALQVMIISSRIVEPLIAASIIVVGVENLVRKDAPADRLWLAGGFGLIHGFGFASVLRETGLGMSGSGMAVPLFSFNLGVEIGQLLVAALLLPMLFALRKSSGFSRYGAAAISSVIILVSGYWFLERTVLAG